MGEFIEAIEEATALETVIQDYMRKYETARTVEEAMAIRFDTDWEQVAARQREVLASVGLDYTYFNE